MALEERGRRITLKADISQLKSAFSKINALSRDSSAELRKIGSALKFNPYSTALLVQKQKELNRVIAQNHKLIGNLKKQIAKHVEFGDVRSAQKLVNQLEVLRSKNNSFKDSLRETNRILASLGSVSALSKLENELRESRVNSERLSKALRFDSSNISVLSGKFSELKREVSILDKMADVLAKDLKKIDVKTDLKGFNMVKARLEETRAEAGRVKLELNKLGGVSFNKAVADLESLDNELKRSRESSRLLKGELKFNPNSSILKSLKLEETRLQLDKTREKIKVLKGELNKVKTNGCREEFVKLSVKISESNRHVKSLISSVGVLNAYKFSGIRGSLSALSSKIKGSAESFKNFGRNFTFGYTLPVVYGSKRVVDVFTETDNTLRRVASASCEGVSSEFSKAFGSIESEVREKSRGTVYSINDIGLGLESLVKAGLNTEQSMGAVSHAMDLAAADGIDLNRATEIITDGMNAMGLEFDKSGNNVERFVDVMNTAAVKSTTDVGEMGEAMKYVGSIAGTLGFSIEDVGVALSIMANQGIKASVAGTTLRSGLTNLVRPSAQAKAAMDSIGFSAVDSTGKMKPLSQIIAELRDKTKGMTDAQKNAFAASVFGKTAMAGFSAILKETDSNVNDFTNSIKNAKGSTKAMADQINGGFSGAVRRFRASFSNMSYELGKNLAPSMASVLSGVGKLADGFSSLSGSAQVGIASLVGLSAAIPPVTWAVGGVVSSFKKFGGAIKDGFTNPVSASIAGGILLGSMFHSLQAEIDPYLVAQRKAKESGYALADNFVRVGKAMGDFKAGMESTTGVLESVYGANNFYKNDLLSFADSIKSKYSGITQVLSNAVRENRVITDSEADSIRRNVDEINSLYDKRIQSEQKAYDEIIKMSRALNKNKSISDKEYEKQFAGHVKDIESIHETSVKDANSWFEQLKAINDKLPESRKMSDAEMDRLYQERLSKDNEYYSKSMQSAIAGYNKRTGVESGFIKDLRNCRYELEKIEEDHNKKIDAIMNNSSLSYKQKYLKVKEVDTEYENAKKAHFDKLNGMFDDSRVKQAGIWLKLIQDTLSNGGRLTDIQAKNVKDFISSMDSVPADTRDKMTKGLKDAGVDIDILGKQISEQMKDAGVNMGSELVQGIDSTRADVNNSIDTTMSNIKSVVDGTSIFDESRSVMLKGRDGIDNAKPEIDSSMNSITDNMKSIVNNTDMTPLGSEKSSQLASGMNNSSDEVNSAGEYVANQGKDGAGSVSFESVGSAIPGGISSGIWKTAHNLYNSLRSLASNALHAAMDELGINSPSRVFKRVVGYSIPEGIALGVTDKSGLLNDSITDTLDKGLRTAKDFGFGDKMTEMVNFSGVNDYVVNHAVSQNNVVVDTLNTLISKVNDLELKSDVFLDGEKVGDVTYKRHEVISRRFGLN